MSRAQQMLLGAMLALVLLAAGVLILRMSRDDATLAGISAADPADAALVARGAQMYAPRCAGCHGANRQGQPGWPDDLNAAPPLRSIARDDQASFDLISSGGGKTGAMPGFGASLSASEIWAIISYLRSE